MGKATNRHLSRVLDFGMLPEEIAAISARTPSTLAEICDLIVSEDDLGRLGRWGGAAAPRHWFPRP
jgi:hypothetical protein